MFVVMFLLQHLKFAIRIPKWKRLYQVCFKFMWKFGIQQQESLILTTWLNCSFNMWHLAVTSPKCVLLCVFWWGGREGSRVLCGIIPNDHECHRMLLLFFYVSWGCRLISLRPTGWWDDPRGYPLHSMMFRPSSF